MPRIFDTPGPSREQRPVRSERPTLGSGPAGPSAQTDNRANLVLIVVALAIVLVVLLFRVARGEELQGMRTEPQATQFALAHGLVPDAPGMRFG